MNRSGCRPLAALFFIVGYALLPLAVSAATVSVTLRPGRLAITDSPTALVYLPGAATDTVQTLDATFTLGVTDATGEKAGWHIDAALGPLMTDDGTFVPILTATITHARVTGLTGVAPFSTLAYPCPFHTDGDTIFSAAEESGVGKSSLTFATEITIPADAIYTAPLTTTLSATIAASP